MRWLARLAIGLSGLTATAALAQPYPDRPVKVVVGFAAGGPTDVIARIVCDTFSTRFGKQFYVVNQPGAGSNTATGMVATSPPDGYTLMVVSTGFVVNPSLFAKVAYDPVKDFDPISIVAVSPNVVSVHPSVPAKTMQERIAVIKANPGKYSFAAPVLAARRTCPAKSFASAMILTCPPYSSPARLPPFNQPLAATRRWPSRRCRHRSKRACCAASR